MLKIEYAGDTNRAAQESEYPNPSPQQGIAHSSNLLKDDIQSLESIDLEDKQKVPKQKKSNLWGSLKSVKRMIFSQSPADITTTPSRTSPLTAASSPATSIFTSSVDQASTSIIDLGINLSKDQQEKHLQIVEEFWKQQAENLEKTKGFWDQPESSRQAIKDFWAQIGEPTETMKECRKQEEEAIKALEIFLEKRTEAEAKIDQIFSSNSQNNCLKIEKEFRKSAKEVEEARKEFTKNRKEIINSISKLKKTARKYLRSIEIIKNYREKKVKKSKIKLEFNKITQEYINKTTGKVGAIANIKTGKLSDITLLIQNQPREDYVLIGEELNKGNTHLRWIKYPSFPSQQKIFDLSQKMNKATLLIKALFQNEFSPENDFNKELISIGSLEKTTTAAMQGIINNMKDLIQKNEKNIDTSKITEIESLISPMINPSTRNSHTAEPTQGGNKPNWIVGEGLDWVAGYYRQGIAKDIK